nr:MAG TPA: hypothetical protein [Caudoviricetes sp.]
MINILQIKDYSNFYIKPSKGLLLWQPHTANTRVSSVWSGITIL